MNKDELIELILNYLAQKGSLSALEMDILSTIEKYIEKPFDKKAADQKVLENNLRYPDLYTLISSLPGILSKPINELTETELRHSLYLQIEAMWAKDLHQ